MVRTKYGIIHLYDLDSTFLLIKWVQCFVQKMVLQNKVKMKSLGLLHYYYMLHEWFMGIFHLFRKACKIVFDKLHILVTMHLDSHWSIIMLYRPNTRYSCILYCCTYQWKRGQLNKFNNNTCGAIFSIKFINVTSSTVTTHMTKFEYKKLT